MLHTHTHTHKRARPHTHTHTHPQSLCYVLLRLSVVIQVLIHSQYNFNLFTIQILHQHLTHYSLSPVQVRLDIEDAFLVPPRKGRCEEQRLEVSGSVVAPSVSQYCGTDTNQHCERVRRDSGEG